MAVASGIGRLDFAVAVASRSSRLDFAVTVVCEVGKVAEVNETGLLHAAANVDWWQWWHGGGKRRD